MIHNSRSMTKAPSPGNVVKIALWMPNVAFFLMPYLP